MLFSSKPSMDTHMCNQWSSLENARKSKRRQRRKKASFSPTAVTHKHTHMWRTYWCVQELICTTSNYLMLSHNSNVHDDTQCMTKSSIKTISHFDLSPQPAEINRFLINKCNVIWGLCEELVFLSIFLSKKKSQMVLIYLTDTHTQ